MSILLGGVVWWYNNVIYEVNFLLPTINSKRGENNGDNYAGHSIKKGNEKGSDDGNPDGMNMNSRGAINNTFPNGSNVDGQGAQSRLRGPFLCGHGAGTSGAAMQYPNHEKYDTKSHQNTDADRSVES